MDFECLLCGSEYWRVDFCSVPIAPVLGEFSFDRLDEVILFTDSKYAKRILRVVINLPLLIGCHL
jgi:hypothetical protein